jgi:hypothetical protein
MIERYEQTEKLVYGALERSPHDGQWVLWSDLVKALEELAADLEDSEPGIGMGATVLAKFGLSTEP